MKLREYFDEEILEKANNKYYHQQDFMMDLMN